MDSFTRWLEITFGVSAGAIVLIAAGIILVKWVFYCSIVKTGTKRALEECMRKHNYESQSQIAGLQKQIDVQQQEIQRLQGLLNNRQ